MISKYNTVAMIKFFYLLGQSEKAKYILYFVNSVYSVEFERGYAVSL